MSVEKVYWFAVSTAPLDREGVLIVERFDTIEQAQLYAAAVGGYVPFADYPRGEHMNNRDMRILYNNLLTISEKPK